LLRYFVLTIYASNHVELRVVD